MNPTQGINPADRFRNAMKTGVAVPKPQGGAQTLDEMIAKYGPPPSKGGGSISTPTQPVQKTFGENLIEENKAIHQRTGETKKAFEESSGKLGSQNLGTTVAQVGGQLLQHVLSPITAGIETVAQKIPENAPIKELGRDIGKGFDYLTEDIKNNPKFKEFINSESGQTFARTLRELPGFLGVIPVAGPATKLGTRVAEELPGAIKTATIGEMKPRGLGRFIGETGHPESISDVVKQGIQKTTEKARESDIVGTLSKQNVAPQLETAAQRLNQRVTKPVVEGEIPAKDALDTYEDFYKSASGHVKDAKVGRPTDEYIIPRTVAAVEKKVIPQLKEAGKTMGDEMKRIGDTEIDVTPSYDLFEKNLVERANLIVNPVKGEVELLPGIKQSKLNATDIKFLNDYVAEVKKLGPNATLKDIEAFEKRNRSAVSRALKGDIIDGNIADIVGSHSRSLLDNLKPVKEGVDVSKYAAARAKWSELQKFLEQADVALGDDTVLGNPSKLNSTLKSAITSIHGTKNSDWLKKLEELTGYNSMDELQLAYQAMKDAGDTQGMSLLEGFFGLSTIPKTGYEATSAGIKAAWDMGRKKLVGSSYEQTKRVLQDLKKNSK